MSLIDTLISELKPEEDLSLTPYYDINGYATNGWGHNYGKISLDKVPILNREQADEQLRQDAQQAIDSARRDVSNFDTLSENRQAVLANIAFNTGERGLARFTLLIGYVQANRFTAAANEIRNSEAYRQLTSRYEFLAQQMEKG